MDMKIITGARDELMELVNSYYPGHVETPFSKAAYSLGSKYGQLPEIYLMMELANRAIPEQTDRCKNLAANSAITARLVALRHLVINQMAITVTELMTDIAAMANVYPTADNMSLPRMIDQAKTMLDDTLDLRTAPKKQNRLDDVLNSANKLAVDIEAARRYLYYSDYEKLQSHNDNIITLIRTIRPIHVISSIKIYSSHKNNNKKGGDQDA